MAELKEASGIRVAAFAPGLVRTPLWLENLHKMRMVEEETDGWVTPEQVARTMFSIVKYDHVSTCPPGSAHTGNSEERIAIKGGIILEVKSREVRKIPLSNSPGPAGKPGPVVSQRAC